MTILTAMRLGDCDGGSLPLAFPTCGMTWPIEEMLHDDAAGCCLAPPRIMWQPLSVAGGEYGARVFRGLDPSQM
ncbi:hypothetical protein B0O99DRAFT_642159 [Bisporella sp. PMI_857]|nr:hypothetical protein B0O99DRAFT_642159 [Bisporella sp. PMI_857]